MFLSAIGLYGTLAYLVIQRRREMGIRLAVGSTPGGIVNLMFREGFLLATAGLLLGVVASLAIGRLIATQLYGIGPSDPRVMLVTTLTLSAVTALACVFPARRAASVDGTGRRPLPDSLRSAELAGVEPVAGQSSSDLPPTSPRARKITRSWQWRW